MIGYTTPPLFLMFPGRKSYPVLANRNIAENGAVGEASVSPPRIIANITQTLAIAQVQNGDGSNGNKIMLAVEIPFILFAITTVVLRIYSRLAVKRKVAIDDVLIVLGLCCAFSRTVISCMSADDTWGFDIKGPDHTSEIPYYQHIFERRICYIFAVFFTRLSILAYYLRIFPPGLVSLRRICWILLAVAVAQFIEVFAVLMIFCKSISKLWTKDYLSFSGSRCFSSSTYSYSAAIGDSVMDSLIFAVPIPYVWGLSKLRARQRLGLVIIFALGFIVCVVALLQIPFIKRRVDHASYFGGAINLLISIQISLAIVTASLPDIRALIARSFPNFSPLHHRTLNNAARGDGRDVGARGEARHTDEGQTHRRAFERRRNFRKPDWLRNTLPASLMTSRNTHTELTSVKTRDTVPTLPGRSAGEHKTKLPGNNAVEKLPTSDNRGG